MWSMQLRGGLWREYELRQGIHTNKPGKGRTWFSANKWTQTVKELSALKRVSSSCYPLGGGHRDRGRFALPQANFLKAPIVAPKEILHFTYGSEPKEMIHQIQNSLHRVNIGPGGIKLSSNMLINDVSVKENKLRCFLWFRQNAAPKPGVVYMEESLWLQCIWAISLIQSMLYSELQPIVISMLFNTHFILKNSKIAIF